MPSVLSSPARNHNILIVGAGIAGPVLGYFLQRFGFQPVVVERAPQLRTSGQNVDLRDASREVARRMGVESTIRDKGTREDGLLFVDSKGRTRAAFGVTGFGGQGFVSEIEILRGELVNVLYDRSRSGTEYIFGDHPSSIEDRGDYVKVTFASGNVRKFDVVIGADGIRSKTRQLVFGGTSPINYLDMYTAYFTIPYSDSDGSWARWYNAPGGRAVVLRPDNQGTTRAYLSIRSTQRGYEELDPEVQKDLLRKLFADAGFETSRVLSGLKNTDDFYFEAIGQVKMERWSQGRVTLVGDAGYCPSPIGGLGTTLALVGAYILAGELARHADHTQSFKQYEVMMRPYVAYAQKIPSGALRFASPQTQIGIALRNAVLSIAAKVANTRLLAKVTASKMVDKITLPDYDAVLRQ